MTGPVARFIVLLSLMLAAAAALPPAAPGAPPVPPPAQPIPVPLPPAAQAEPPASDPAAIGKQPPGLPSVERLAPGRYRLAGIEIDKRAATLSFPAEINMNQGLLEYLLVKSGGKTHESLLRTRIEPYHLQLACLLLGLEGTDRPIAQQGAAESPSGDPVEISLRLADGSSVLSEQWLVHEVDGVRKRVDKVRWVFTGSLLHDGTFAAQADGSMVAVYRDPVAIIDNASPGGENDRIWFVRPGATPAVGTPVTVVIKALK